MQSDGKRTTLGGAGCDGVGRVCTLSFRSGECVLMLWVQELLLQGIKMNHRNF